MATPSYDSLSSLTPQSSALNNAAAPRHLQILNLLSPVVKPDGQRFSASALC